MSSKTKIVVLHLKELIYTGIFAVLGILFIILLIIMFLRSYVGNHSFKSSWEQHPVLSRRHYLTEDPLVFCQLQSFLSLLHDVS